MKRMVLAMVLGAALSLVGGACGGSGGESSIDSAGTEDESLSTDEIITAFVASGAPRDEAECVAPKLDDVSQEEIDAFVESDGPEDVPDDFLAELQTALADCGLDT